MDYLGQVLLNGVFSGALYAQIAIGITLIFGIVRVGDLAQGSIYALAGYLVYIGYGRLGMTYWISAMLAVLLCAGLSMAQGHWVYRPLKRLGIGPTFLGAIGLLVIVQNALALAFSWEPQALRVAWGDSTFFIGSAILTSQKGFVVAMAFGGAMALALFLKRTRLGKSVRAISQNDESAKLLGIHADAVTACAFAIAGGLSGAAGAMMSAVWPLTPYMGSILVVKAFAVAVIARQHIWGAALTALAVGMCEALVQGYGVAHASDLVPFALLAVVLFLRRERFNPEADGDSLPIHAKRLVVPFPGVAWRPRLPVFIVVVLLALLLVLLLNNLWLHLLIVMGLNVLLVSGLDLLTGYAGIPSLAQAGLWGIGAYTSALVAIQLHWSFPASMLASMLATIPVASLIAHLGLRLRGHWTSFTFLAGVVITLLIGALKTLTGGTEGMIGIPPLEVALPSATAIVFSPLFDRSVYLYGVVAAIVIMSWMKSRIVQSRFGRSLMAIREDETLACAVGIPTNRYKHLAFLFSAAFAGVAGSVYAHYLGYLNPDLFTYTQSFGLFVMNVVGGAGTLLGPILGPVSLTLFDEATRPLSGSIAEIAFGALLIIVLICLPGGMVQGLFQLKRWLHKEHNEPG